MFLSVKALVVGAFNKEKAIVGAFSVIVKTNAMDRCSTNYELVLIHMQT